MTVQELREYLADKPDTDLVCILRENGMVIEVKGFLKPSEGQENNPLAKMVIFLDAERVEEVFRQQLKEQKEEQVKKHLLN